MIAIIIALLALIISLFNMFAIHLLQKGISDLLSVDQSQGHILDILTQRLTRSVDE